MELRAPAAVIPVIVITGPVGVGKTTVATAIADRLRALGVPHALIDLDWLRATDPTPTDDPFHMALGLRNLAAVWANYRAVGASHLVVADVVENRAQLAAYARAVPGAQLTLVRLSAPISVIHSRLARRESGVSLEWHRARALELIAQMERDRPEDYLVETAEHSPEALAARILHMAGWPCVLAPFADGTT